MTLTLSLLLCFVLLYNAMDAGQGGYYVAGPPLLNGRCTSQLRDVVSEMTYTVSSGTLNSTIQYHTNAMECSSWS